MIINNLRILMVSLGVLMVVGLVVMVTMQHLSELSEYQNGAESLEPGNRSLLKGQNPKERVMPSKCTTSARAKEVTKQCRKAGYDNETFQMEFTRIKRAVWVDDKHKLVYCMVPKSGSQTFSRYLWKLHVPDDVNERAPNSTYLYEKAGIKFITKFPEEHRRRALRDYMKLIVVRHPLDRLISAWRTKFSESNTSTLIHGRVQEVATDYVKQFDPERQHLFDYRFETLPFEAFIHLVSNKINEGFKNGHWANYYEHCWPCHIHYDHVFRIETLSQDAHVLYDHLRKLNIYDKVPELTHANNDRPEEGSEKLLALKDKYRNIPKSDLQGLLNIYGRDMELFGYHWDDTGGSCFLTKDKCC